MSAGVNTASPLAARIGFAQAFTASLCWGLMPVYFKFLADVPALETVAHRIIWLVPMMFVIIALRGTLGNFRIALGHAPSRWALLGSSVCIALNWLIYVYAINTDHIVAASLGYFLSPLVSVALGMLVLKEKLSRAQMLAVIIAALGVAVLVTQALDTLWISLILAVSWALYSLIRKMASVGPMVGLTAETSVLFLPALGYAAWSLGQGVGSGFGSSAFITAMMIGGALVTAGPLLLFAAALPKVRYSTIGLMQYIAPTMQFLIGIFLYQEPLTTAHMICFAFIWAGLALYTRESLRLGRAVS